MRPRLPTVDRGRGAYRATALVRRSFFRAMLRLTARISDHKHTARHTESHEAPSQDTSPQLHMAAYKHRRGGPKAGHTTRGRHQTVCGKPDGRVHPRSVIHQTFRDFRCRPGSRSSKDWMRLRAQTPGSCSTSRIPHALETYSSERQEASGLVF